jgi:hypothetical protein
MTFPFRYSKIRKKWIFIQVVTQRADVCACILCMTLSKDIWIYLRTHTVTHTLYIYTAYICLSISLFHKKKIFSYIFTIGSGLGVETWRVTTDVRLMILDKFAGIQQVFASNCTCVYQQKLCNRTMLPFIYTRNSSSLTSLQSSDPRPESRKSPHGVLNEGIVFAVQLLPSLAVYFLDVKCKVLWDSRWKEN